MILSDPLPSKSGRITLVPPQKVDDAAVAALRCYPETRRYIRFFPEHVSVEESLERRIIREADSSVLDFNIHALAPGSPPQFAGTTGIFRIDNEFKSCEVGILVSPGSFREGIATDALYTVLAYAFEELKFHRAVFLTRVDNVGMRGWLDRAGATLEGINRESWSDGKGGFTDVCLYSILEGEWSTSIKARLEERIKRIEG
ncbi:acyl-CoA N-acyltransferase [Mycena epipterygia]|nr:acyl-CoA N-acyltransferase [Mycena epipterygia]